MVTRREDGKLDDLGPCVKKVRKTAKGGLLLELARKKENSTQALKGCIEEVLGSKAEVRAYSEETKESLVELRGLDALASSEDIIGAISQQAAVDQGALKVKKLRSSYGQTPTAIVAFPASLAKAIFAVGKVKVGWSVCHMREKEVAVIWSCGATGATMHSVHSAEGFVRVRIGGAWLYSCYMAPSLTTNEFERMIDCLGNDIRGRSDVLVAGDFNAWAQDWGCPRTNARGRVVRETFASLDLVLLNEGNQHTFSRAGAGSIIDLTFASPSLTTGANWRISG
ncbi:hypothetical protein KR074_009548, partial [Drosophila pseudoananassae]